MTRREAAIEGLRTGAIFVVVWLVVSLLCSCVQSLPAGAGNSIG